MIRPAHFLILALCLAQFACTNKAPRKTESKAGGTTLQRIKAALAEESTNSETESAGKPPASFASALMPELAAGTTGGTQSKTAGALFDLAVDRVSARAFFMGLVKGTHYNMVVHPAVQGEISLHLKKVTIEDVMQTVRDVFGYEYEMTASGFIVLPARLQSRIFRVDYLNVQRSGESTTRVNSGQLTETIEGSDTEESGTGTTETRSAGSQIVTETQADFWSQLKATLVTIIGNEEGRSVVVSPQTGIVVVRAMPGELRDIDYFLATALQNLQRQVILEAKIVEVELSDGYQAGINWADLGKAGSGSAFIGQGTVFRGEPGTPPISAGGVFDPRSVAANGDQDDFNFGGLFAIGAFSDDFGALLSLLSTQGDAQVLSSPRVSTINNQKAIIKVGTDEFFVTEIESTTTTGTATTTTPSIKLTPFFSGIALDVTPHISQQGDVILHIHPTVSDVQDQTKSIVIGGEIQTLPLALSSVRESDSIVRARNGQVVVIGGLMQDKIRTDIGATPGLSSLPIIGGLFTQEREVSVRSELVILLRPIVIDSGQVWREALNDASGRVQNLYPEPTTVLDPKVN